VKLPGIIPLIEKRYMPDRVFIDTNILIYFISDDKKKKLKAAILSFPALKFLSAHRSSVSLQVSVFQKSFSDLMR